jgi:hypothetical protein
VPYCPSADFLGIAATDCPPSAAVGVTTNVVTEPGSAFVSSVYNLKPPPGVAAKIGFWASLVPVTVELTISPNPP